MKPNVTLTITSLLTILFLTFHLSDEITRGMEPGRLNMVIPVLVLGGWMYGALALSGRRSGYIIMLLGSILGVLVSLAHMRGAGLVGGRIANSGGKLFWVWTILAVGVTSVLSLFLSARALWRTRTSKPPSLQERI